MGNLCPSEVVHALALIQKTVHDRFFLIEYNLASEGTATSWHSDFRRAQPRSHCAPAVEIPALLPVSVRRNGLRTMSTWCQDCFGRVESVVDAVVYEPEHLLLMPTSVVIPRIPSNAQEQLRDPVSAEDLEYLLGQLPNGKAPEIPYDLWKRAQKSVNECLRQRIDERLVQKARPPQSWPGLGRGGLVPFLFKKGDSFTISCFQVTGLCASWTLRLKSSRHLLQQG